MSRERAAIALAGVVWYTSAAWLALSLVWPVHSTWRLERIVRRAAADLAAGGDVIGVAPRAGVAIITLGRGGDRIGSINRDGVDRLPKRLASAVVGERLGGARYIMETPLVTEPFSGRPEVQRALAGEPSSGCWRDDGHAVCWAVRRQDQHITHYVLKSSPRWWW